MFFNSFIDGVCYKGIYYCLQHNNFSLLYHWSMIVSFLARVLYLVKLSRKRQTLVVTFFGTDELTEL